MDCNGKIVETKNRKKKDHFCLNRKKLVNKKEQVNKFTDFPKKIQFGKGMNNTCQEKDSNSERVIQQHSHKPGV